jgi:Protein of unknown function (DUF3179)
MMQAFKKLSRQPLFWLAVCVVLSLFLLVYPVYVIRVFRYQGASELGLALAILRFRATLAVALIVVSAMTAALGWRQNHGIWQKAAASMCAVLVILIAFLSRVNIYELMFHPLDTPTFARASDAKLDGREEVIAVRVSREARAYPIRSMSYHHIVNDVVGGTPIVATY